MRKKKLLCIVQHRYDRSPGQRFRIEQFLPYMKENNWEITYSNILSEKDDQQFYSSGKYFAKFCIMMKSAFHRFKDIRQANKYDAIFVYREAFMLGTTYFEKRLSKKNPPLIYDFDDSIWLNDTSAGNQNLSWLKKPQKTAKICSYADLVTVGNKYLSDYASDYNQNVKVIPTVINTDYHVSAKISVDNQICIGWTGTETTLKHFEIAIPVLKKIYDKYGDKVKFRVIVNFPYTCNEIPLEVIPWSREDEIEQLSQIDIGIMPLPDDQWSRGKCGFKGLQYMSLEIPTIMSPVGVNTGIINDGENGFLAVNEAEWEDKISQLIESKELRHKFGLAGRQTIIEKYSKNVNQKLFLSVVEELITK